VLWDLTSDTNVLSERLNCACDRFGYRLFEIYSAEVAELRVCYAGG